VKKILLSFADDKYKLNQRLLTFSAKPYFDEIIEVGPEDIEDEFFQKHKEILTQPRGQGYWLWKPYFIARTLEYAQEGDIVFYIDSGNEIISDIQPLFDLLQHQDIVVFKNRDGNPTGEIWVNSMWTKADCFNLMGCNDEKYKTGPQVDAAYILLKKSKQSVDFINEYLTYSTNKHIITDEPNTTGENEPDFQDHRHDQSVLSLLAIKHQLLVFESASESANHVEFKAYPQIFNHLRRNLGLSHCYHTLFSHPKHKEKYAVISTNSHPDYLYYLPIVTKAWNKLGYKTIVLLLNDNPTLTDLVLQHVSSSNNLVVTLNPIDGIPSSTIVQISRIFAGCLSYINDEDLLITSDIDMIPLSGDYFNMIDHKRVFNILDAGEAGFTRHKICYVAARKKHWKEILDLQENINDHLKLFFQSKQHLTSDEYWNIDEVYLFDKLSNSRYYEFSNFIDRGSNHLNLRNYRLDRADVATTMQLYPNKAYDCHSIRAPYNDFSTLKNILKYIFTDKEINKIEIFNSDFNELLRRESI